MKVLFVCVHNSGRSQMAEAFTRTLSGGAVDACSAGTIPDEGLNPVVAEVMEERGIRDEVIVSRWWRPDGCERCSPTVGIDPAG